MVGGTHDVPRPHRSTDRASSPRQSWTFGQVRPGWEERGSATLPFVRRHLTLSEVKAALRRGSEVEQLIRFGVPVDGRATLTFVWLSGGSPVTGRLEHCFDDGSPSFFDVGEFQDVDDDAEDAWDPFSGPPPDDGVRSFDCPEAALEWARSECDASDERWVNQGVIDAEYRDAKGW
jgi:hypothetical protein